MERCVSQRFLRMAGDETELAKNDEEYIFSWRGLVLSINNSGDGHNVPRR